MDTSTATNMDDCITDNPSPVCSAMTTRPSRSVSSVARGSAPRRALIIVDFQNDFTRGGTIPVPRGDEIGAAINGLMPKFHTVVATQDWHPPGHVSFADWPMHCVAGTFGAHLHRALDQERVHLIMRKGTRPGVESYSAFTEDDGRPLGLAGYLRERGIAEVFVCGLALEYCVNETAIDSARLGFRTFVIDDACRALNSDPQAIWDAHYDKGIMWVSSAAVMRADV